jgi:hypothetical protein
MRMVNVGAGYSNDAESQKTRQPQSAFRCRKQSEIPRKTDGIGVIRKLTKETRAPLFLVGDIEARAGNPDRFIDPRRDGTSRVMFVSFPELRIFLEVSR